jgi:hypothetical protein
VDGVVIASSYPGLCYVAGRLELAEDLYCGALQLKTQRVIIEDEYAARKTQLLGL